MSVYIEDELIEDAEIEGLPQRSRFGSFVRGTLLGVVVTGGVLLGLTLNHPLPGNLPGIGTVRVTTDATPQSQAITESGEVTVTQTEEPSVAEPKPQAPTEPVVSSASETSSSSEVATKATDTDASPDSSSSLEATASIEQTPQSTDDSTDADTAEESATELAAVTPAPTVTQREPTPPPVPEIKLAGPAHQVNASNIIVSDNAPILAIVLEDAGNGAVEADKLDLWPFPVTLAIAPDVSSGADLADAARAADHEVLLQLPFAVSETDIGDSVLHSGLSPEALQTSIQGYLASMPMALGVIAPAEAVLPKDRAAMTPVVTLLQEHGFAWIDGTAGNGSAVASLASDVSLVHGVSNRLIPKGASKQEVRNGLESAAFTARQRGSSIVRIPVSKEALETLLEFALVGGNNSFRIAPVSAVLNRRASAQ